MNSFLHLATHTVKPTIPLFYPVFNTNKFGIPSAELETDFFISWFIFSKIREWQINNKKNV
jgi:hypothetical protein